MEVKERRPYRSLTARQDTERRYTSSSADSEDGKPNPKSYSSSETLKAFDHDSRMAYGSRVKEMVHHEVDEFNRQGWPQLCQYYEILCYYVNRRGYHHHSCIKTLAVHNDMNNSVIRLRARYCLVSIYAPLLFNEESLGNSHSVAVQVTPHFDY